MSLEESPYSIVIIGPDTPEDQVANITKALATPPGSAIILGDGKQDISLEEIKQTLARGGEHTHIHILMHGHIKNEGHFVQNAYQGSIPTASLLPHIKETKGTVHLWSCYGGAASKDVTNLGEGLSLICHSGQKFITRIAMSADGITCHHDFYQQILKMHGGPSNPCDAFELSLLTSPETMVFSQVVGGEVKSFKARAPKGCLSNRGMGLYLGYQLAEFRKFRKKELGHDPATFLDMSSYHSRENYQHYREQALIIEASRGKTAYVEQYLNLGINPDVRLKDHFTALHLASYYGHPYTARKLLEKGANISTVDSYGRTPLICAVVCGHTEVVARLLSHPDMTLECIQAVQPGSGDAIYLARLCNSPQVGEEIARKIEEKTRELLLQEPAPTGC